MSFIIIILREYYADGPACCSKLPNPPGPVNPPAFGRRRVYANLCYENRESRNCLHRLGTAGSLTLRTPFPRAPCAARFSITREQSCGDALPEIGCLAGRCGARTCPGLRRLPHLRRPDLPGRRILGRRLYHSRPAADTGFNFVEEAAPNIKDQCLGGGSQAAENSNGTAFGQVLTRGRKMLVLLPGSRKEWEPMFPNFLDEEIKSFSACRRAQLKLKIAGLWKPGRRNSCARSCGASLPSPSPSWPGPARWSSSSPVTTPGLSPGRDRLKSAQDKVYGEGRTRWRPRWGRTSGAGRTLAAAESCIAGWPRTYHGCSRQFAYFSAAVAYSNAAKTKLLGVRRDAKARRRLSRVRAGDGAGAGKLSAATTPSRSPA